jgi:predicted metal-dependent hydrolase
MNLLKAKINAFLIKQQNQLQVKMGKMLNAHRLRKKLLFNPKDSLKKLEKTLTQIKIDNDSVNIDNFESLYTLIHKTNGDIRY